MAQGCPSCGNRSDFTAGGVQRCAECNGQWVPEGNIVAMMRETTANPELGPVPFNTFERETSSIHSCPECGRAMTTGRLEEIVVQRCPKSHGYWFDGFELEGALFRAGRRAG
jgi:Zn-finger nucleic acid-binding protein